MRDATRNLYGWCTLRNVHIVQWETTSFCTLEVKSVTFMVRLYPCAEMWFNPGLPKSHLSVNLSANGTSTWIDQYLMRKCDSTQGSQEVILRSVNQISIRQWVNLAIELILCCRYRCCRKANATILRRSRLHSTSVTSNPRWKNCGCKRSRTTHTTPYQTRCDHSILLYVASIWVLATGTYRI